MHYRIGADTNILFSGIYFQKRVGEVLGMVSRSECTLTISEYVRDELLLVAAREGRSPKSIGALLELENVFLLPDRLYARKEVFATAKKLVRDEEDVPVFAAAHYLLKNDRIDYFLSGDEDLLTEKVRKALQGRMLTAAEFLGKAEKERVKL